MDSIAPIPGSASLKQLGVRACGTCVKAKVKCIPTGENKECQRCHRLQKECLPSSAFSRRRPPTTQVAHLGQKLDKIVSLLTKPNQSSHDKDDQQSTGHSTLPSKAGSLNRDCDFDGTSVSVFKQNSPPFVDPQPIPNPRLFQPSFPQCAGQSASYHFDLGAEEASVLFDEYKTNMAKDMFFVIIPPHLSSEDFRRERPFLWKAVMTAASYRNSARQVALGWRLLEELTTRVLFRAERSLDIVQGLLIHISWYHFHSVVNPQMTNLIHLLISLITNLGYHRTRSLRDRRNVLMDGVDPSPPTVPVIPDSPASETLEEWRALTGYFVCVSHAVFGCRRFEPIQFTSHMQDVCQRLAEISQYESDRKIIHICKLQPIFLKQTSIFNDWAEDSATGKVPINMYIKLLRGEIDSYKQNLPEDELHDIGMAAHYQSVEISVYEFSLYSGFNLDKFQRLDYLHTCLLAVKSFFITHFTYDSILELGSPYEKWFRASHMILIGLKLCFCTADGWDQLNARETLNLPCYLDLLIQKSDDMIAVRTQTKNKVEGTDIFYRFLRQLRRTKTWYESILTGNPDSEGPPSKPLPPISQFGEPILNHTSIEPMEGILTDDLLLGLDESFWASLHSDSDDWMMYNGLGSQ